MEDLQCEDAGTIQESPQTARQAAPELLEGVAFDPQSCISKFSVTSGRLDIPLCRMLTMPVVRPAGEVDILKLMKNFHGGYKPGALFYVGITSYEGVSTDVTAEDKKAWGPV